MHHQITSPNLFLLILFLPFCICNAQNATVSCPLDFTILTTLSQRSVLPATLNATANCQYLRQALRLVVSDHLRRTNTFLPPLASTESCWLDFQRSVNDYLPGFDIRGNCGFGTSSISQGCMNISTRVEFENRVQIRDLDRVNLFCNHSLNSSICSGCITSIVNLQASLLNGDSIGGIFDCAAYATIYGAGIVNPNGPSDLGTADCLFYIDLSVREKLGDGSKKIVIVVSVIGSFVIMVLLGLVVMWVLRRRRRKLRWDFGESEKSFGFHGLDSVSENSTLMKFRFDVIKSATNGFARENIIGSGGYGNVYRGVFKDGTEVALKRFKNVSAPGDATFAHELEIIASLRHVNLLALRGYCTGATEFEGHQRIIVCDLMKNGSLYDHLFMSKGKKLSWPVRRKIALGTAQGLAYLHNGVQPAIIHRDIKASNILLDDKFEPKIADFGLAKFTPEGMTHLSTRVAGTMGYVAPEYALYGQVSDRCDVYSFGIVLLELLSGRKAIMAADNDQLTLLSDWGWSLVKEGKAVDVIEENMVDLDPPEIMEKYISIAMLCSHPQLYARPTVRDVIKLMDTDIPVPDIPDRPSPFVTVNNELEKSSSSVVSGVSLFTNDTDEQP